MIQKCEVCSSYEHQGDDQVPCHYCGTLVWLRYAEPVPDNPADPYDHYACAACGADGQGVRSEEQQARALVDLLRSVLHPEHVWREQLSGRWVVFVRHEEQTYCLLPLQYEAPVVR